MGGWGVVLGGSRRASNADSSCAIVRLGLQRKVAVAVPHFLVAPHIVASSDLLLTVAERVAEVVAGPLGLVVLAPPQELELTGFTLSILWHERTHEDPARRWLRDALRRRQQDVRVAVLACNGETEGDAEGYRVQVAHTLLGAVTSTTFGRLVLSASGRASLRLRQELLSLTGTLSEQIQGTTATVSLRFTESRA